jgi:hypothetical protein
MSEGLPLYERILGPAWEDLPGPIRAMHDVDRTLVARGRASVERGRGLLAAVVGQLFGFPPAAADTALTVRFDVAAGAETWTRSFGATTFSSRQFAGKGRSSCLLCERFGPLGFAMALVWNDPRLSLVLRRWSFLGVPLPLWLGPTPIAHESVEHGRFTFHVEIGHPLTGLIVRYRGWLEPDPPHPTAPLIPTNVGTQAGRC